MESFEFHLAELNRRLENMVGVARIAAVDHGSARLRLDINGRLSGWLPWPAEIGKDYRMWRPLREGTQVAFQAPGGDPANAVITKILYSDDRPAPETDPDSTLVQFDDGTFVRYDAGSKTLTAYSDGDLTVECLGVLRLRSSSEIKLDAPVIQAFTEDA
ncbi:MAG: phage baseplate assembly protein V [Rhodospirillaceae bacterium]